MNSLGTTVIRSSKRSGAGGGKGQGEQGRRNTSFTSDPGEGGANDGADSDKKKRKGKGGKEVSMQQAFAALQRATSAPFIADESVIAPASDQTVPIVDSDVEITLEELPPKAIPKGVRVGHQGWVTGSEPAEDEEEEEDRGDSNEGGERTDSQAPRSSRAAINAKTGKKSSPGGETRRKPGPKTKKGRPKDEFDLHWSSDSREDDGGGGAAGSEASGGQSDEGGGPKTSNQVKVKGNRAVKKKPPQDTRHAAAEGESTATTTPQVHAPALDDRPSRSELKTERREAARQEQAKARKEAGLRAAFVDWIDAIRQTNPFEPEAGQTFIWSRSAAEKALVAVGVTFERWRSCEEAQLKAFFLAAVAWLEANKPKGLGFASGQYRVVVKSNDVSNVDVSGDRDDLPNEEEEEDPSGEGNAPSEEEEEEDKSQERAESHGGGGSNGSGGSGAEQKREEDEEQEPPAKKAKTSTTESQHRSVRAERRRESQEEQREGRRDRRAKLSTSQSVTPKALGRSKQAELDKHKRVTKKRERAKREVKQLIEASLLQQKRQKQGKQLTSDEQQLASFAKTLSPTKLLGAGIRLKGDGGDAEDEPEYAAMELMEETGCDLELAREALDLSCEWSGSGRPSTLKAAQWLMSRRNADDGDDEEEDEEERDESDEDVQVLSHQSPGGTVKSLSGREASGGAGRRTAELGKGHGRGDRRVDDDAGEKEAKSPKTNRKSVPKSASRGKEGQNRSTRFGSETEEGDSSGSLSESLPSDSGSDSERTNSTDSDARASSTKASKKRDARGDTTSSSRGSWSSDAKREARYVRQLELALNIDAGWAREIYKECAAQGTTSYDGLLRSFYRREVALAKGTQKETARALGAVEQQKSAGSKGGALNVSMPTFQLPEWGPGQPPNGGVHFPTFKKMLEAYEKYDKQTNFNTQVTFKSMVKAVMKPNFESKCKLPETVWLPPVEGDWRRVLDGKPEEGGWSDMRFIMQVRRMLRPKGRTTYEVAFEGMVLRHRGSEEQLAVSLDLWGTTWLAKEKEAVDEGKVIPAAKMKSYFRKAVSGIPRFRRWLEGREFVSSKDWYGVLCRKLQRSLGQREEAAYDREREDDDRSQGDYNRGGGAYRSGRGGSGVGGSRGGGAHRGGRGGSTGSTTGTPRSSPWSRNFEKNSGADADAQGGTHTARGNAHTAGVGISPHSGGVEPMHSERKEGRGGHRGGRGELRGVRRLDGSNRQVNSNAEETKEKLPKGPRWHDSTMASCKCRDPDCGTRQDVPFCQGCGLHGHDRPFCYKAGEPMFNPSGYWCVNRPNEAPIEGLGKRREGASTIATSRSNMMDASKSM